MKRIVLVRRVVNGKRVASRVEGEVYGVWAVTPTALPGMSWSDRKWSVTHAPTGACVRTQLSKKEARTVAKELGDKLPRYGETQRSYPKREFARLVRYQKRNAAKVVAVLEEVGL